MATLDLIAIDGVNVDGTSDIVALFRPSEEPATRTLTTVLRSRSFLPPVLEDVQFDPLSQVFYVFRDPSVTALSPEAYRELVHRTFPMDGLNHTLTIDWDGDEYELEARIVNLRPDSHARWTGTFEILDTSLRATTESATQASPITITGNAIVKPVIDITNGQAVTRVRHTLTDATGHGFSGYLFRVPAPSGNNHAVYANGLLIPHTLLGGGLYFRADGEAGQSTFVDVYGGDSIVNELIGELSLAGMTLDAGVASGQFESDPADASINPLAPSLTWHLGPVVRHSDSREYEFGWVNDRIELVDRDATGERRTLDNDVDAYILTSPVEIDTISDLELDVFAGYRVGRDEFEGGSGGGEPQGRVLRVTLSTIDGSDMTDGPVWDPDLLIDDGNPNVDFTEPTFYPQARNSYLYYAEYTFGGVSFPNTRLGKFGNNFLMVFNDSGSVVVRGRVWIDDHIPWELTALAEQYIGCTVTRGAALDSHGNTIQVDGTTPQAWYLHFPPGAYAGVELPDLSLSLQPKSNSWDVVSGDVDFASVSIAGDTTLDDILVFSAVEVDANTLKPLDTTHDDPDLPALEESLVGQAKAFVKARYRESEQWVTLWSETVSGAFPDGDTESFSPNVDVTGAMQIAVGLEPVASGPNQINWGSLQITSAPTVTVQSSRGPGVNSSINIDAQRLHGTLTNTTTGEALRFDNVLTDAGGLVIDCERIGEHAIASEPVDVWYGRIYPSAGVLLFDLRPGNNAWTASGQLGNATIEFRYHNRLVV